MKNALIVILIIGLAISGKYAYSQRVTIRLQEQRIRELGAKLDEVPKTPTLEQQGKCAAQAREEFTLEGYKPSDFASFFQSHFNVRLNKCFVETMSTDTKSSRPEILTTRMLVDAFEGKVYGSYIWSTQRGKKFWEVPPLECKVTVPSGEEKICHSDTEFDELVKPYLE